MPESTASHPAVCDDPIEKAVAAALAKERRVRSPWAKLLDPRMVLAALILLGGGGAAGYRLLPALLGAPVVEDAGSGGGLADRPTTAQVVERARAQEARETAQEKRLEALESCQSDIKKSLSEMNAKMGTTNDKLGTTSEAIVEIKTILKGRTP